MFGKNPLRQTMHNSGDLLEVEDIFYTLQGEGPFSGHPAVFVRLAGCNLRCWFCDTEFESYYKDPDPMTAAEVVDAVEGAGSEKTDLVVITGGEPLRQDCSKLIQELTKRDLRVQIETAGTVCPPSFPWNNKNVTVVCSPKTGRLHPDMVGVDAWKYIISSEDRYSPDGLPTFNTQVRQDKRNRRVSRPLNTNTVYLSPMDEYDKQKYKANLETAAELCMQHGYILTTQIHKEIGLP